MTVYAVYFSPTGTTKKIVSAIAQKMAGENEKFETIDFTPKKAREIEHNFKKGDVVIMGVPTIAGRVPNVLLKYFPAKIKGNGATGVSVVLYGNRNFDDSLIELRDIMTENGFTVIAGGAFIGEHSFSKILAAGRPDDKDVEIAKDFADDIVKKIDKGDVNETVNVKGQSPYREYYRPKDKYGNPVDIRKVQPKTNDDCIDCKLCAEVCPMESIDHDDTKKMIGICIKCGACEKLCPVSAKYYDDENYLKHKHELEDELKDRKEPELFI